MCGSLLSTERVVILKNNNKKNIGGISAKSFVFPVWAVMVILLTGVVLLIIDSNRSSNDLFDLMERSGAYQLDATNMQASNTIMSETGSNYVQVPVSGDGAVNVGPLLTYAKEVNSDRRAPKVLERFRSYDVSPEVLSYIEKAAELSEQMLDTNLHAISLMASVHPLPPIPELSEIKLMPLTPEEAAMPAEAREAYAHRLITEKEFAQLRFHINENIECCIRTLQNEFSVASAETKDHVAKVRTLLWIAVIAIILVLSFAFRFFYHSIIKPLIHYSKDISSDRRIEKSSSVFEMRQLSTSFNGLLDNRNNLETVLRAAAENDSLTGLPNRYCLKRDMVNSIDSDGTIAVLLFDVNFLKRVNDTEGHLAGDNLLRNSAACISECFGVEGFANCYRIGGDEFVALLKDCTEDEVKARIDKFVKLTNDRNVTVSVGYAYTESTDAKSLERLMEEADKRMYENKRHIHSTYDSIKSDVG